MPATGTGLKALAAKLRSPQYRSALFAQYAKGEIARIHKANEAALETKLTPARVTVDGRRGAPLVSVKPDGRIIAEWNTETEAVRWVLNELQRASPVLTGAYAKSHRLYADGRELSIDGPIPLAGEYIVLNDQPYARQIEGAFNDAPQSKQAPEGVYQVVAALALRRFGRDARIYYGFHSAPNLARPKAKIRGKRGGLKRPSDDRVPAIFIRPELG